jgi:hypothetical protein
MRLMKTKIAILLILVLCLQIKISGQLTQTYKNGFVAATNNGVYYLQDGVNEWVNIGNKLNPYDILAYTFDTVTSITFYNNKILCNTYKNLASVGFYEQMLFYIYGYKNNDRTYDGSTGDENILFKTKNSTNKLKNNGHVKYIPATTKELTVHYDGINTYNYTISDLQYWTSMATDNDSILVWTGTNNKLYKTVISPTVGYRSNTAVSGLASNAASAHQICYDSNNDLFWIVSDEGIIYSYDKTTVTKGDTILPDATIGNVCDSIQSICFNDSINTFFVSLNSHTDDFEYETYIQGYLVNEDLSLVNAGSRGGNATTKIEITSDNKGWLLASFDSDFWYRDSSGIYSNAPNLPVGTIVYDLDYIDYLPYVAPEPWTYEGVMTVGEGKTIGVGYYYEIFGSVNPVGEFDYFWWAEEENSTLMTSLNYVNLTSIYINGSTYIPVYDESNGDWRVGSISNPFPAVGETCTIKLRYN